MKKYNLRKITNSLYENSQNVSSRVITYPEQNEKILKNPEPKIDRINIGADTIDGSYYIRTSFRGSDKWYTFKIRKGTEDEWWNVVKFIIDEQSSFNDFMFEHEVPIW